jgi:site-specific recombinase XerD
LRRWSYSKADVVLGVNSLRSRCSRHVGLLTRTALFISNPRGEPQDVLALVEEGALPLDRHPVAVYLAGLAPGSRRTMRAALRVIAAVVQVGATDLTLPWWHLDYAHAAAIRAKLAVRFAPATANRMLAAMRGVLKAAFKLGLIDSDRMTRACAVAPVRGSRVQKGRALSKGELTALFETCDPKTPGGSRNAALLGLLYGGGLRRAEVVALDLGDFDTATGQLVVNGKGNKQRVAYVTNGSRDALDAWLVHRGDEHGPLFMPVSKGGTIMRRRMTDGAVAELVRRLAKESRIATFSPHDIRRTFIGDMLDAGADIATVQQLAGHASPTTTSRYDRRGDRAKKRAAELLHVPFARRA